MEVHKGTTRLVFTFKNRVVKLALPGALNWRMLLRSLKMFVKKNILKSKEVTYSDGQEIETLTNLLTGLSPVLAGLKANWREYIFYINSYNPFLAPTQFSFFGLVNIQTRIEMINFNPNIRNGYPIKDISVFVDHYYNEDVPMSVYAPFTHHLLCPDNYGWDYEGHLVLFDYGEKAIRPFVKEKGEELHKKFVKPS